MGVRCKKFNKDINPAKVARPVLKQVTGEKKAGKTGFFIHSCNACLQCLDLGIQTAFMPGSLVSVDQAFAAHLVDDRYGLFVGCSGSFLIAFFYFGGDSFQVSPEHGTKTHIMLAVFLRLAGTFLC